MRIVTKAHKERLERALDKANLVDIRLEEIKFRYELDHQEMPQEIVIAFRHVRARRLNLALAIFEDENEHDAAEAIAKWIPARKQLSTQDWTDINEIHLLNIGATK